MASAQGLDKSQSLSDIFSQFKNYEDPAGSWIDLVASMKTGDPSITRACLAVAKHSHWTHEQWELAIQLSEEEDDADWEDFPNAQDPAAELDAPQAMMDAAKLRHIKQETIDEFFEE